MNSKRLTGANLQQIARSLELPTGGSNAETRQVIEGKLIEMGREPQNVQVLVRPPETDVSEKETMYLIDMDGVFLEVANFDHGEEVELEETTSEVARTGHEKEVVGEDEESEKLKKELEEAAAYNRELEAKTANLSSELDREREHVSELSAKLEKEQGRVSELWKMNCLQLANFDETLVEKDAELERLQRRVAELEAAARVIPSFTPAHETLPTIPHTVAPHVPLATLPIVPPLAVGPTVPTISPTDPVTISTAVRRGKAPPVGEFSAENAEIQLDDWLPSLERTSIWNSWTEEELLMQFAGHLKGRALQEWNLLKSEEKATFSTAVESLRARVDPGSKTLAAQDFRHTVQKDGETVADFIRRLERTFRLAYGRDRMSAETRDMLMYGQLQEGLRYDLMRGPAVSGAIDYSGLCVAARNEEKRLADLRKRQQYSKSSQQLQYRPKQPSQETTKSLGYWTPTKGRGSSDIRKCFICKKPGHLMRDCKSKRSESKGSSQPASTRQVTTGAESSVSVSESNGPSVASQFTTTSSESKGIFELLYSDSEDENHVKQVRVTDGGSQSQLARVDVLGVPADGVIDTGAEITIMGRDLFARVAAVAHLRKKDFRKSDKVPRNYDGKIFHLDGCMDMDITFDGKTMKTIVYIKSDASDQLLLSEGVSRQLGIVTYHPSVQARKARSYQHDVAVVPTIRVQLVKTLRLPPGHSKVVEVDLGEGQSGRTLIVEPKEDKDTEEMSGLKLEEAVVNQQENVPANVVITNYSGFTQTLASGTCVGIAEEAQVLDSEADKPDHDNEEEATVIRRITSLSPEERKQLLLEMVKLPELEASESKKVRKFLAEHHDIFSLEDGERGETNLTQLVINTGDAAPMKQPPRKMPFVVRQEVAKHLKKMQETGVIQPSSSPWSSPVVMVRKKDGTHRFCVDYRGLNSVTKPDAFPLPRISDILDQLGGAQYFSSLDLASGFWQILVDPQSQEKTAFATPHGLFEFRVMPFGLTNAPAVFQRLMQEVLAGLNPEDGKAFVSVYIDDILVFSSTLEEHLDHLGKVMARLRKAFLKLKPLKCNFIREEVEHLGHILTKEGVKTNCRLTEAVREFPQPKDIHDVRRFLGLSSYYRRFIPNFARIAQPLHQLTAKGVSFEWTADCEAAFKTLKDKLTVSPVLAYPSFDRDFTLETDASVQGLGAILSQVQDDGKLHPVAYASRALNPSEKNYSVTELETLAVVWAITHFHSHLYGNNVHVLTDHSAVKAILETPNPTGKHARWWTRVYGRGVKDVRITYRAGRENVAADALSRSPRDPAPLCGLTQGETQVAIVRDGRGNTSSDEGTEPSQDKVPTDYAAEQAKDSDLREVVECLHSGKIPDNHSRAKKLVARESLFTLVDGILYYLDHRRDNRKRVAVPRHLREKVLQESHRGVYSGHFAGNKLYNNLVKHWWWDGMYADAVAYCKKCPECAIVTGGGCQHKPPLSPIPVQRPFQIIGVDIMDLPSTESGNKHVIVFQDMFTKWPMVFPVPDQKSERIARLLCEEIVPLFGVPEALLSDRGTNLLSHLMLDVCALLGTTKLNTTAYHPECDGMVERFNRTLKAMLRKRVAQFGAQWDKHLPGLLWAYRNTPHDSTGEKPSFLLFGWDCRSPLESTLLPVEPVQQVNVSDYREELMLTLASARQSALEHINRAQTRYKTQYDRKTAPVKYHLGDWVLLHFPSEESGKKRKLSRPWHGPYRVMEVDNTNITAQKVYFPRDDTVKVHQNRVKPCPGGFMAGYYWYGNKRKGPGRPPKWVETVLTGTQVQDEEDSTSLLEQDTSFSEGQDINPISQNYTSTILSLESDKNAMSIVSSDQSGSADLNTSSDSSSHRTNPSCMKQAIPLYSPTQDKAESGRERTNKRYPLRKNPLPLQRLQ